MTRVVLCTSGGLYGALVFERLLNCPDVTLGGVVLSTRVLHPAYGWLRGALAQLRRSGPAYTLYLGCATTLADRLLGHGARLAPVASRARRGRIPLLATRDLNDAAGHAFIGGLHPDLLVSAFFNQRIGEAVCGLPAAGAVNIHPSLLPDFRGVDPVFYARLRGAARLGVSLHRVTAEFDTGPLLAQAEVVLEPDASVLAATARLFWHGAGLLLDRLPEVVRGTPGLVQADGGGYDSWPSPSQVRAFAAAGHRLVRSADLRLLRLPVQA